MQLDHTTPLTLEEVERVALGAETVSLSVGTRDLLAARRADIVASVTAAPRPSYGFNRGFGHNVHLDVGQRDLEALQANLIRSHSSGVGEPAPVEWVRAAMLLRAKSLAKGHSGVRPEVVEQLLAFLAHDITPVVPRLGSVSASGDLAPLSHVALGLIGEGEVFVGGVRMPTAQALAAAGLRPLVLGMKEGLALNNGVQYTAAIGVLTVLGLERLLKSFALITSVSAQVMLGSDTPFRSDLHALRPHPNAVRVAGWIRDAMAGSPLREAHRPYDVDGEIQDPYNLRCAAQILGPCLDLTDRARATLSIEIDSVTDNPILLADPTADRKLVDIVSGGHFHGMPLAVDLYGLVQAMGIAARLSNMRCVRYVDEARNKGLGADLKWPGPASESDDPDAVARLHAISSALMIPEYSSAGLTNWIWGQAMPSHLFSMSTDAGQEDHVSMAVNVAIRAIEMLPRLAEVFAIELAFAAQAADIRKAMAHIPSRAPAPDGSSAIERYPLTPEQRRLSPVGEAVVTEARRHFPRVEEDRPLYADIARLAAAIGDGAVLRAVEGAVGE
jgi:histidine ammonia-lyase